MQMVTSGTMPRVPSTSINRFVVSYPVDDLQDHMAQTITALDTGP